MKIFLLTHEREMRRATNTGAIAIAVKWSSKIGHGFVV